MSIVPTFVSVTRRLDCSGALPPKKCIGFSFALCLPCAGSLSTSPISIQRIVETFTAQFHYAEKWFGVDW